MSITLDRLAEIVAIGAPLIAALLLLALIVLGGTDTLTLAAEEGESTFARFWRWLWRGARRVLSSLRALYLVRFPLLLGLLLVSVPAIALCTPLEDKVGNLFVVSAVELGFVTLLSLIVAWIIVRTAGLALKYGPERFRVDDWPVLAPVGVGGALGWLVRRLERNAVVVLAAPLVVVSALKSVADSPFGVDRLAAAGTAASAAAGAVAGTGVRDLAIGIVAGGVAAMLVRQAVHFFRLDPSPTKGRRPQPDAPAVGGIRRALGRWIGKISAVLDRWWFRWLGDGYSANGVVHADHLAAIVQLFLCVIVYLGIGFLFSPYRIPGTPIMGLAPGGCVERLPWLCMPTLGYLCVVIGVAAWALSAASFLLDRWRVPTVLALAVVFGVIGYVMPADHYYRMSAAPDPAAALAAEAAFTSPPEIVARALDAQAVDLDPDTDKPLPKRLIVVAVSGGGITSAAWSARVLTGLEETLGAKFLGALSAVSSVSGGSIGSMYYLGAMSSRAKRKEPVLQGIRAAAATSSMRPIAWGIAYPDLLRAFAPFTVRGRRARFADRALGAEVAWEGAWSAKIRSTDAAGEVLPTPPEAPTLHDLRTALSAHDVPVPLFNAMTVEDGQHFIFTPADLLPLGKLAQLCGKTDDTKPLAATAGRSAVASAEIEPPRPPSVRNFCTFMETYPKQDVPLVTAARLSASFPWVSPVARPAAEDCPGCERLYHLSDGGYFDNDGLMGAMAWLDQVLPTFADLTAPEPTPASAPSTASAASVESPAEQQAKAELQIDRSILIIQIRWGKWTPSDKAELADERGGLFQLVGPLNALLRARGATQTSHNAQTVRLMNERWSREVLERYRVGVEMVDFDLHDPKLTTPDDGFPLAWQLTDSELGAINARWCDADIAAGVNEVAKYLRWTDEVDPCANARDVRRPGSGDRDGGSLAASPRGER